MYGYYWINHETIEEKKLIKKWIGVKVLKYFTKNWYNEMQVYGFLVFPDTKEEWEEMIKSYGESGINYKKMISDNINIMKSDLLNFLPSSLHSYIHNGTLRTEFPSPELRKVVEQWQKEYNVRKDLIRKKYTQNYNSIKEILPKGLVQLHEKSLHDAKVISYNKLPNDKSELILDCRGAYHYNNEIKVTFLGVREVSNVELLNNAYWIYDEVYIAENGFELNVLFECPLTEFLIIAEDVRIEEF